MTIDRDRAIMHAVGSLTEADLERFGALDAFRAHSANAEIEDIDFVEYSVVMNGDAFQCLGTIFFTDDGVSDDISANIAGVLRDGVPQITAFWLLDSYAKAA